MVVPVLMTNCQVSENPNIGPVAAQPRIVTQQSKNVIGLPAACATPVAILAKLLDIAEGCVIESSSLGVRKYHLTRISPLALPQLLSLRVKPNHYLKSAG